MAANTTPIFPLTPNVGGATLYYPLSTALSGAALHDGTTAVGTAIGLYYTAGAAGARIDKIRFKLGNTSGGTASGTTNATVAKVWINNGSANTTATNNVLYDELTLPATAVSATAKTQEYEITMGISIPAGYKIYVGLGTAAGGTNCAWIPSVIGGDY